jgi:hypothetical protein
LTTTTHSVDEYLEQAAHNSGFAQRIRDDLPEYMDWSAACLFYSAVHYVNAYLAKQGIPIPRRHRGTEARKPGRTNIVQSDPGLSRIYRYYRHLDDESRDARYELKKITTADYDSFLLPNLVKIREFIIRRVTA